MRRTARCWSRWPTGSSRSPRCCARQPRQLRGAPAVVRDLLAAAPSLCVLATSQAPLRIDAEHVMALGPLPPVDAQRLFVERATARRPGFDASDSLAAITTICKRLDELAAARTAALSPENLLDRLDGARTLLIATRPRPSRAPSQPAGRDRGGATGCLARASRMLFGLADGVRPPPSRSPTPRRCCTTTSSTRSRSCVELSFLRGPRRLRRRFAAPRSRFRHCANSGHRRLVETGTVDEARAFHARWIVELAEPARARRIAAAAASAEAMLEPARRRARRARPGRRERRTRWSRLRLAGAVTELVVAAGAREQLRTGADPRPGARAGTRRGDRPSGPRRSRSCWHSIHRRRRRRGPRTAARRGVAARGGQPPRAGDDAVRDRRQPRGRPRRAASGGGGGARPGPRAGRPGAA